MGIELYHAIEDARITVYLIQNTPERVILSVTRITGYLPRHHSGASNTSSYLDSSIVKLVASSTVLWMLGWNVSIPTSRGRVILWELEPVRTTEVVVGLELKLLQLVTFQYILIPKCKLLLLVGPYQGL